MVYYGRNSSNKGRADERTSMKKLISVAVAFMFLAAAFSVTAADAAKADGKAVFEASKCGTCHFVPKAEVGKKPAEGKENKAPNLPVADTKYDAATLAKYLQKTEAINGKKHMAAFKGTDAELTTLATWIVELRADAKK